MPAKMPRFYFDLTQAKKYLEQGQTPWTPAVPQVLQLREGLRTIEKEGLQNCFARHARFANATREGVKALGLKLLAEESCASNAVTSSLTPAFTWSSSADRLAGLLAYRIEVASNSGFSGTVISAVRAAGQTNWTCATRSSPPPFLASSRLFRSSSI